MPSEDFSRKAPCSAKHTYEEDGEDAEGEEDGEDGEDGVDEKVDEEGEEKHYDFGLSATDKAWFVNQDEISRIDWWIKRSFCILLLPYLIGLLQGSGGLFIIHAPGLNSELLLGMPRALIPFIIGLVVVPEIVNSVSF